MLKKTILMVFLFLFLFISFLVDPVLGLSSVQQNTLSLLIVAMTLWTTRTIPTGITSLGVIGLQLLFGIASSFEDSVRGFLFTPIYFILSVSMLNHVLIKIELDKKISQLFLYHTEGSIKRIAWRFFLATTLTPMVIPSGNARFQMFLPFMEAVNKEHHLPPNSSFVRFTTWTLAGLNQMSTLIVFTGGGLAVLAFQLLSDLGFQLTWISWFLLMAPPIWLTCIILGLIMFTFFLGRKSFLGRESYQTSVSTQKPNSHANETAASVSPQKMKRFWFVCMVLILLILLWIIGPWIGLSTIVPVLLALVLFSMPGINLLSNKDFRNYDWENFLLLGSALSLAVSIEENGTAKWMSETIFSLFEQSQSDLVNLLSVMFIILFIRCLFVSPSGALTVIYPLVMTFSQTLGLNSLYLFLITTLLASSFMILPMHSPIMVLAYGTGHIWMKEHILFSICALVTIFLIIIGCYFFYWPMIL